MAKHTPGPWEWCTDDDFGGFISLVGGPDALTTVLEPNHRKGHDPDDMWFDDFPSEADRRLIAEAPDLLAFVERMRTLLEKFVACDRLTGPTVLIDNAEVIFKELDVYITTSTEEDR